MPRTAANAPLDEREPDDATDAGPPDDLPPVADLSGLPVVGITRRRIGFLAAAFVAAWIVIVFARQAGEAAAATARADSFRADNAQLAAHVDAMRRELELIQRDEWVAQQARAHRIGPQDEIPFTLAADAPPLAPDAPGSAAVRLGGREPVVTPLESWLSLLFGPSR